MHPHLSLLHLITCLQYFFFPFPRLWVLWIWGCYQPFWVSLPLSQERDYCLGWLILIMKRNWFAATQWRQGEQYLKPRGCWSWNSSPLATWWEELTHWKRPWCWERLKAGGEGVNRGWDGWMASPTQWTWVWVGSGSWWWIGSLACCSPWDCKESDMTELLNWTERMFWDSP